MSCTELKPWTWFMRSHFPCTHSTSWYLMSGMPHTSPSSHYTATTFSSWFQFIHILSPLAPPSGTMIGKSVVSWMGSMYTCEKEILLEEGEVSSADKSHPVSKEKYRSTGDCQVCCQSELTTWTPLGVVPDRRYKKIDIQVTTYAQRLLTTK